MSRGQFARAEPKFAEGLYLQYPGEIFILMYRFKKAFGVIQTVTVYFALNIFEGLKRQSEYRNARVNVSKCFNSKWVSVP